MSKIINPYQKGATVRQENNRVLVIDMDSGKTLMDLPWQGADQIADALKRKARLAEEYEKRDQIINDQAILTRAGAPFGLSNNPKILDEAKKEAVSNRDLRKYMPGGVKSKEMLGTPTVTLKEKRK